MITAARDGPDRCVWRGGLCPRQSEVASFATTAGPSYHREENLVNKPNRVTAIEGKTVNLPEGRVPAGTRRPWRITGELSPKRLT